MSAGKEGAALSLPGQHQKVCCGEHSRGVLVLYLGFALNLLTGERVFTSRLLLLHLIHQFGVGRKADSLFRFVLPIERMRT